MKFMAHILYSGRGSKLLINTFISTYVYVFKSLMLMPSYF